jgi:hypothetical protein
MFHFFTLVFIVSLEFLNCMTEEIAVMPARLKKTRKMLKRGSSLYF